MKYVIDIPKGLKIDFENESWTALSCMEMKDALVNGKPLDDVLREIKAEIKAKVRSEACCLFTAKEVLEIIDKYRKEQE